MRTGARSVRPSRGWQFVKICARDAGGFPARASPGRSLDGGEPAPHLNGRSGIRVGPGSSLMLAFDSQTQPNEGSSALPAGGPLVRGALPGDSSSESRPGSRRLMGVNPARVTCAVRIRRAHPAGRRSSRRAARARWRTRLSRNGRRCARLQRPPTASAARSRLLLHAGFAQWRGLSAAPGAPRAREKPLSTSTAAPARIHLPRFYGSGKRC